MRETMLAALLLPLLLLPFPSPAAAGEPIASVYSSLASEACTQVSFDEEHGSSHLRCPGVAGYRLDLHDSDARMSLDVLTPDGKSHPLDFWQVVTWGFSSLGDKAEWRLAQGKPLALIVRLNASENAEDSTQITSYLVVAKLQGEKICVTAKIAPSAEANQEARRAADAAAGQPCLPVP